MSYKKFTSDMGILGLTQVIAAVRGIITLPIITKLLGAQNYGVWTQLLVTMGLISSLVIINLPYALVRFLPGEKDERQVQDGIWSVFALMSGILLVVALLLVVFSGPISGFLGSSRIFILILAPIVIFDCINSLLSNILRALQEIKKYSLLVIVGGLAETALVISAILLGYGLVGAVVSFLIIRIVMFLITISIILKRVSFKIPEFLKTKEYLSFCLPLIPGDAAVWIVQSSDRYFIGFFLGTLFVGYYAPAYTLGCIISFLIWPLSFILPAALSEHHNTNKIDEIKKYLKYSLKYFLVIAIPSVFGISILAKQLLNIFSTREISQHSYFIVPFVTLSMLLAGVYVIIAQNLLLKKRTKISGAIWIAAAILNFSLNFIFIPWLGILGAAITTLMAYGLALALAWHYSSAELRFEIDWKFILKSACASLLMSVFVLWANPLGLWKTLGVILIGAVIYFLFLFLFKGFEKKELAFFGNIFSKEV